jgi:hypothetical protein
MFFALAAYFLDPVVSVVQRMTVQAGNLRNLHELLPGALLWTGMDHKFCTGGDEGSPVGVE